MKILPLALTALMAASAAAAASGPMQPPMNNFDFAFYTCDGGAFQIAYDSATPKSATLTTTDDNKQYVLARQPVADGVQFASGAAKFWTNGQKVVVDGTAPPLRDCRMKSN